jgi:hypothetical protein
MSSGIALTQELCLDLCKRRIEARSLLDTSIGPTGDHAGLLNPVNSQWSSKKPMVVQKAYGISHTSEDRKRTPPFLNLVPPEC